MGTEELEVKVRVLEESFSGLSRDHARLQEVSTFLDQRVHELEKHLAGRHPADGTPRGAAANGANDKLVKVQDGGAKPAAVEPSDGPSAGKEEEAADAGEVLRAHDLDRRTQEIPLASSSWDACLLVGSPALSWWGSISVGVGILINSSIQIIFCALVFANFLTTEFSKENITGLKAWRLRVAHDDRLKSASGLSLASRVCGLDPTLEVSNEQAAMVDLIRSYIPSLDPGLDSSEIFSMDWMKTYFDGPIMCLVAVCCWVLTVSKEIGSVFDLVGVVMALPGGSQLGVQVRQTEDGAEIVSAGSGSKAFMLFVCTLRLGIAVALLAMGILYLAYTSSMQDLLLNAVALECVMSVDELVFEALSPRRVRQVVGSLAPLKLAPWPKKIAFLDLKTLGLTTLLLGLLAQVWLGPLAEHTDNLRLAHDSLCSGFLDFTAGLDDFSVMHVKETNPFDSQAAFSNLGTPQDKGIEEVINGTPSENRQYTLAPGLYGFPDIAALKSAKSLSQTDGIYGIRSNVGCHDALDLTLRNLTENQMYLRPYWNDFQKMRTVWLSYINSERQGTTCSDLQAYCSERIVYSICPRTCGCDSFLGGPFLEQTSSGCPTICRIRPKDSEKTSTTCEDAGLGNTSDPKWQALTTWAPQLGGPLRDALLNQSCSALSTMWGAWLCESPEFAETPGRTKYRATDSYAAKLFTHICPETCNCGGKGTSASSMLNPSSDICPDSCYCPWSYPVQPSTSISTCNVPHYAPGLTLQPVQASGECCFLMQKHSALMRDMMGGIMDNHGFFMLMTNICHNCRTSCLNLLWSLQVVENPQHTYPSAYFLATTGSDNIVSSAYDTICSSLHSTR